MKQDGLMCFDNCRFIYIFKFLKILKKKIKKTRIYFTFEIYLKIKCYEVLAKLKYQSFTCTGNNTNPVQWMDTILSNNLSIFLVLGSMQPSSSSRAAELLTSSGQHTAGFVGFGTSAGDLGYVPATGLLGSEEADNSVDGDFRLVLRKLSKRDATTKLKVSFELLCPDG